MIEFGNTLRTAREAKGLTVRQLAELTRMAPTTIQELESENFTRIAAPIYGRGFVKLYCEAVGLEAKPLVDEFMEIYNGNREANIRERPLPDEPPAETAAAEVMTSAPADAPAPTTETETSVPVTADDPPSFELESAPAIPPPVKKPVETDLFTRPPMPEPAPAEPPLSRYAAPMRHAPAAIDSQTIIRLLVLAIGAIALLVLLAWGIRSIYRATTRSVAETPAGMTTTGPEVHPVPAPAEKPAAAPAKPAATAPAKPAAATPAKPTAAIPAKKTVAPAAKPTASKTPAHGKKPSSRTPQKIPALYL